MTVTAAFYSRLREIVGVPSREVELPDGASVRDMLEKLIGYYPLLLDFKNSMLFGIGVEFVNASHPLREGDVIAIMPPVQGG